MGGCSPGSQLDILPRAPRGGNSGIKKPPTPTPTRLNYRLLFRVLELL